MEVACPRPHLKSEKAGVEAIYLLIKKIWPCVLIQLQSQDFHPLTIQSRPRAKTSKGTKDGAETLLCLQGLPS